MLFNVRSFLQDYDISHTDAGKNSQKGWLNIQCPLCDDDSDHGGFNLYGDYYHCWRCGRHNTEEVIKTLLNVSWAKAKEIKFEYTERSRILDNLNKKDKKSVKKIGMPGEKLQKRHKKYLKKRNFDPDFIEKKYKITGTGIVGDYKYRIIIPIYYKNILVSFQGRDITDQQQIRYKNLAVEKSIMNPKHILYNIDNCYSDRIGIVEGVFDVWRMGDGFVSCFGTSITERQIKILSKYKNIFFLFDPEEEARQKAKKTAYQLSAFGCKVEIIDLEKDQDPAQLTEEDVYNIRKELKFD